MKVIPVTFVLGASTAAAFAPVRPVGTSSFVPMASAPPMTQPMHQSNLRPPTHYSSRAGATALQMNLFDRFFRVTKSNLNLILNSLEDPEKILSQATADMQNDLVKIRQSYAEVTAVQRRLARQKQTDLAIAEDWYNRAQLALKANKDELAREAIVRRQIALDKADATQKQIDTQAKSLDKLYEGMQLLEQKIMEASSKKSQIEARARTAKTTMKVNDMLSGITGKTSMDAFKRMEEKVEALESAAEVSAEMGLLFGSSKDDTSIETEFARLEASSAVDDELDRLKKAIHGEPMKSNALPAGDPYVEESIENQFRQLERKEPVRIPISQK